ncbi:MAG: isopentenyl-diphosphate Delta-isomerase [Chitinophagaceae bacterium]
MTQEVVLVNELDEVLGTLDKNEAHQKGLLHRAVSVVILNSKNEMLLQRRATTKYHSASLWTNAACTHPYLNEPPIKAAERRLQQEMGIELELEFAFKFIYKVTLENGMIENELDYVYFGVTDKLPVLNRDETDDYKYINITEIENEIQVNANSYTEWFKILLPQFISKFTKK